MSPTSKTIFREAAIDRLSSPDQLDHLVVITRPADWIAGAVLALALVGLLAWGVLGRVSTRVAAEGLIVGSGGALVEASADIGGRLGRVEAAVGDRVARGQQLATLVQADLREGQVAALATATQRTDEYERLRAASERDARAQAVSDAARTAGFRQAEAAATARVSVLTREISTTEGLVRQGLATQPELEQMRVDLAGSRQRAADARNAILALDAERLDREARRARDLQTAQFRVADARREADSAGARLGRESRILSPIAGRVTEIKVAPGAVLAPGAPVAVLETGQGRLQALIYLPPDDGKRVRPGMRVRLEPSTVRREEHGLLLGRVQSVSPFPATPEGMAAALRNADLVARFRRRGAPYSAVIAFDLDPKAPSGYRWSSGRGPDETLAAGALVRAEVVTRRQRPIELMLPLIRRLGRGDFGGRD